MLNWPKLCLRLDRMDRMDRILVLPVHNTPFKNIGGGGRLMHRSSNLLKITGIQNVLGTKQ